MPPALATRINEMPHLDRLRFETTHVFLKVAVSYRQSLVQPQVLRPRFNDERFDVVRRKPADDLDFFTTSIRGITLYCSTVRLASLSSAATFTFSCVLR